jgi:hypothetical protein
MFPLLLLLIHLSAGSPVHPQLLRATDITCETTEDCLAQYDYAWCHSGLVCLRGLCQQLPSFPCPYTEWCDEREKRCLPKNCSGWRDCDDGLFCTGVERCVGGRCVSDHLMDCGAGICSEEERRCSYPLSLVKERERLLSQEGEPITNKVEKVATKSLGDGSVSNTTLAWIIGIVGGLVAIAIFCWVIVQANRRVPPTILIDRNESGSGVYLPEAHY